MGTRKPTAKVKKAKLAGMIKGKKTVSAKGVDVQPINITKTVDKPSPSL